MRLGVVVDSRFYKTPRGYFTPGNTRGPYWRECAKYFDKICILARCWQSDVIDVAEEELVSGDRIEIVPLPPFDGAVGYLRNKRGVLDVFRQVEPNVDVINGRGPGFCSDSALRYFGRRLPTFSTVMTDPEGVWGTERNLYRMCPPLWYLRGPFSRFMGRQYRRVNKDVDCVIGVSTYLGEHFRWSKKQPYAQVADTKLGDAQYVPPRPRTGPLKAVAGGRLWEYKNYQAIIRAIATARQRGCECHLDMIGDGYYVPTLKALAGQLGVADIVKFSGRIESQEELWQHYTGADVSCLLSYSEGLPLAAIEAMATGLPMLIADLPYADDIVDDGVEGFRVGADDVEAAADRLMRWSNDEPLRFKMATAAFETAKQSSMPREVKRFAEIVSHYTNVSPKRRVTAG